MVTPQVTQHDTAQAHVAEHIASMLNDTPREVLDAKPTVADRFRDMLRYIDRETTRATYRTMTGGLEFVAATGENQHTLVVTMPPSAKVLWDRLAPLVHRAGLYAGFNTIETREVAAEVQQPPAELREWRIPYYTMSDTQATAMVKAANETAARQIVDKLPDCAAVIGGLR